MQVPRECLQAVFNVACFLDPKKPFVKALFTIMKRCVTGKALVCTAATPLTYPLKIWDTCDCPITPRPWDDGVTALAMPPGILAVGASSNCLARLSTTLAPCLNDLGQQDGCCSEACWRKMNTLGSRECVKQYMASVCSLPDQQRWARAYENLSKRCIEDAAHQPTCQIVQAAQNSTSAGSGTPGASESSAVTVAGPWWRSPAVALSALLWVALRP
jgi:hypothetical protein